MYIEAAIDSLTVFHRSRCTGHTYLGKGTERDPGHTGCSQSFIRRSPTKFPVLSPQLQLSIHITSNKPHPVPNTPRTNHDPYQHSYVFAWADLTRLIDYCRVCQRRHRERSNRRHPKSLLFQQRPGQRQVQHIWLQLRPLPDSRRQLRHPERRSSFFRYCGLV